jgi:RNA polymerase-interacting CarD/CdnL/TRCF family regulator
MESVIVADLETYAPGDWIVHRRHGAGQIESLEEKAIGESKSTYCKIRTPTITVWLPAEKMNDV